MIRGAFRSYVPEWVDRFWLASYVCLVFLPFHLTLNCIGGVRDKLTLEQYRSNLLGVRQAVPALLALFSKYEIHATWAVVGFLLFESKLQLLANLPHRKPHYANPDLSPYSALDQIGNDECDDPYHFAPSLVRRIVTTPHQELASHTFSH